jgi:hypothetical protein
MLNLNNDNTAILAYDCGLGFLIVSGHSKITATIMQHLYHKEANSIHDLKLSQ